jgi:hypothetical protein
MKHANARIYILLQQLLILILNQNIVNPIVNMKCMLSTVYIIEAHASAACHSSNCGSFLLLFCALCIINY